MAPGWDTVLNSISFHHNLRMQIAANRTANRTAGPRRVGWAAVAAFVLAALAAGSVVYWALKWPASRPATASQALAPSAAGADPTHLARALGDTGAPLIGSPSLPVVPVASISSRLNLVGVVANARQGGTALISIDGKPARPFRVGAKVEGEWSLQSVAQRRAVLSSGAASGANAPKTGDAANAEQVTLDLPMLKSR